MKLAIERLNVELDILKNNYKVFTKEGRKEEAEFTKEQGISMKKAVFALVMVNEILNNPTLKNV